MNRKLNKSFKSKSIHGVCGGIAEYLGLYPFGVRLVFIIALPFSIVLYILLANTLDEEVPYL
ncbi:PspC domain-containing protein [Halobacillus naozhouensis]|uniref:PspC domain-containing protein n=1 Tax=Halobacillus naozhouensis TaxID=554880 RepID=A0ABY8J364_9BACI|nr:PspC domain-containing protein [Halobacillus naozhouensis]WFT76531.1 PspC domain-containing protein [Halobacillus naozhouensis]